MIGVIVLTTDLYIRTIGYLLFAEFTYFLPAGIGGDIIDKRYRNERENDDNQKYAASDGSPLYQVAQHMIYYRQAGKLHNWGKRPDMLISDIPNIFYRVTYFRISIICSIVSATARAAASTSLRA